MEKSDKVDKIISIIKEEVAKVLNESMNFWIDGYNYQEKPQSLGELSMRVFHDLFDALKNSMNPFQYKKFVEDSLRMEQLTPDGDYWGEERGVMNLYLRGIPKEYWQIALDAAIKGMQKYNATLGQPKLEDSGAYRASRDSNEPAKVYRIPVAISPEEIAPSMNLANANARKLMTEFLGYKDFTEGDRFQPSDILMRIAVAEKRLQSSDMRSSYGVARDLRHSNIYVGEIGKETVERYLANLKEIAEYAIKHGYNKIAVG